MIRSKIDSLHRNFWLQSLLPLLVFPMVFAIYCQPALGQAGGEEEESFLREAEDENETEAPFIEMVEERLDRLQETVEELVEAYDEISRRVGDGEDHAQAPAIENGVLHAFHLNYIEPKLLAETLETFLGTSQLRLVPDEENDMLLTYSSENMLQKVHHLVETLEAANQPSESSAYNPDEETRSLQIRIFWLADGVGESSAENYLPAAVIDAVRRLGLESPRLVAQSATSVAGEREEASQFQFHFPARVGDQSLVFESEGEVMIGPQPQLELHVVVASPRNPVELAGKLSAPLGHYMVLGTTNYAVGADSTRFAFVVQVVASESYAPEE